MKLTGLACLLIGLSSGVAAEMSPVTSDAAFTFQGQEFVIYRSDRVDASTIIAIEQANQSCSAPCLSPMFVAADVATLGELEVIEFLSSRVEAGEGLLVDARMPDQRAIGFIPASINIPAPTMSPENPYRNEILMALGAEQFQGVFSYVDAISLVVFDAGPATQDAPTLIADLLAAGYPADKLAYYRGGMQVWATLGLSTQEIAQ